MLNERRKTSYHRRRSRFLRQRKIELGLTGSEGKWLKGKFFEEEIKQTKKGRKEKNGFTFLVLSLSWQCQVITCRRTKPEAKIWNFREEKVKERPESATSFLHEYGTVLRLVLTSCLWSVLQALSLLWARRLFPWKRLSAIKPSVHPWPNTQKTISPSAALRFSKLSVWQQQ